MDSLSNIPIKYGSISLLDSSGSKTINGGVTDKGGRFTLTEIKSGTYTVLVEAIGYASIRLNDVMLDEAKGPMELKPFYLVTKQNTLQTVTVTTSGKLVTNKIDKLIYNAERE